MTSPSLTSDPETGGYRIRDRRGAVRAWPDGGIWRWSAAPAGAMFPITGDAPNLPGAEIAARRALASDEAARAAHAAAMDTSAL